ncbi:MAG: hypothetical protein AAGF12_17510 [Myxococcota bacterium]
MTGCEHSGERRVTPAKAKPFASRGGSALSRVLRVLSVAAVRWVTAALLVMMAGPAQAQLPYRLEVDPCVGVTAEEVVRIVDIGRGAGSGATVDVTVTCVDGDALARLSYADAGWSLDRRFAFFSTDAGRARHIALELAELLAVAEAAAEVQPRDSEPRAAESKVGIRLGVLGAMTLGRRPVLFGGEVGLYGELDIGAVLALGVDLRGGFSNTETEDGRIDVWSAAADVLGFLSRPTGWGRVMGGVGLRLGFVAIRGFDNAAASGQTHSDFTWGPVGAVRVAFRWGQNVDIGAGVLAGYVARPVRGLAEGRLVVQEAQLYGSLSLRLAVSF